MKKISTLLLCLFAIANMYSQSRVELSDLGIFNPNNAGSGSVYFNQSKQLNNIISGKINVEKHTKVWRVRIYMGSGKTARNKAESVRHDFVAKYPDIQATTKYPSPYFKVFAGSFQTRIEAESFRRKIKNEYPDSRVEFGLL